MKIPVVAFCFFICGAAFAQSEADSLRSVTTPEVVTSSCVTVTPPKNAGINNNKIENRRETSLLPVLTEEVSISPFSNGLSRSQISAMRSRSLPKILFTVPHLIL